MTTLIERLKNPEDHYECTDPKKANAVLMSLCQEAADALAAPVQERTDYAVHLNHCNIGECEGVCKYLDDDCPALKHADMKAKWDRSTPPAQPAPVQSCYCLNCEALSKELAAYKLEKNT
jgi:hypothetical protein